MPSLDRVTEVVNQLLARATEAMVIIGADGRMLHANPQAEKVVRVLARGVVEPKARHADTQALGKA